MAKFLSEDELNTSIRNIIQEAQKELIIVSPYIKLHERIKSALSTHLDNHGLIIKVLFGKNEQDPSKSISREDVDFFTRFLNIYVAYESRLHAKYFANETTSLITSMNLYDYSQNNNVEVGIQTELQLIGGNANDDAYNYFKRIIDQAHPIFKKEPVYETTNMRFSKTYKGTTIRVDKINEYFPRGQSPKSEAKIPPKPHGYCIRTGTQIEFNPKSPLSADAYKSWSKFSNPDYPEKFCHFSGEPSNGETTFSKPILKKNWQQARKVHGV